jgi:hypothetical protein
MLNVQRERGKKTLGGGELKPIWIFCSMLHLLLCGSAALNFYLSSQYVFASVFLVVLLFWLFVYNRLMRVKNKLALVFKILIGILALAGCLIWLRFDAKVHYPKRIFFDVLHLNLIVGFLNLYHFYWAFLIFKFDYSFLFNEDSVGFKVTKKRRKGIRSRRHDPKFVKEKTSLMVDEPEMSDEVQEDHKSTDEAPEDYQYNKNSL